MGDSRYIVVMCEVVTMYRYRDYEKLSNHSREEWEKLIYQWVLDKKAREVLEMFLLDKETYEDIAEALDISRDTVAKKIKEYVPKLFKH